VDWKRIKAEYIAGGTSYRKLAEKYGVSFNTLKTRAREEQWYELRQQKDHKTTTKIVESLSDKDAEKAIDIIDVADKLLSKISAFVEAIPLDLMASSQSMKHLTSALKDIKDIKGIKSEADIREQEARIAKLRKEAEREDDTSNEIEIVFNAGPGEWNE
jgi:uncharacterized protein YjcR